MKTTFRISALAVLSALSGCFHILTPTELADRGTRVFHKTTLASATTACADALATLGYKVTVKDAELGVVKTAPKVIQIGATGGNGYANVTEDALSWSVHVKLVSDAVRIHAVPRGSRNGSDISQRGMPDVVIDPKFKDLWSELATTLGPAEHEAIEDSSND